MKRKKRKSMLFNEEIDLKQRLFVLNVLVTLIVFAITLIELLITDPVFINWILLAVAMAFIAESNSVE